MEESPPKVSSYYLQRVRGIDNWNMEVFIFYFAPFWIFKNYQYVLILWSEKIKQFTLENLKAKCLLYFSCNLNSVSDVNTQLWEISDRLKKDSQTLLVHGALSVSVIFNGTFRKKETPNSSIC